MYDFQGKVALVTGAFRRRGLGCNVALRLAREGADVAVSDVNIPLEKLDPWDRDEGWRGLDSLVEEIEKMGRRALAVTADISQSQDVNGMVARTVEKLGGIDILVNNASLTNNYFGYIPLVDTDEKTWERGVAVNLTGTFLMCKAVAKQMIKQGRGGKIINMSSAAGKRPLAGRCAYSASKAGVISLTHTLGLELAQYKVNVNAVCPSWIMTWGTKGAALYEAEKQGLSEDETVAKVYGGLGLKDIPLGRPAKVQEVVSVVAFLASGESSYMTGQAINVTGGRLMII